MRTPLRALLALSLLLPTLLASCTSQDYDAGDGKLSYMRADFADLYTNSQAEMTRAVTDNGETLPFTPPFKVKDLSTPDSVYRALLYYNKVEAGIEPLRIERVIVPSVKPLADISDHAADPVQFDSSWLSDSGRYINIAFTIKTGTVDGTMGLQTVGMAIESVTERPDGTTAASLRMMHNQNKVPEYYSVKAYLSIPVADIHPGLKAGDEITISINTYKGEVTKTFRL